MATVVAPCNMVQGAPGRRIERIAAVQDIEPVWSGHPVGFCLLTVQNIQYAAYYNAARQMTVAQRELGSDKWTYTRLTSHVVWDSHNYITMVVDAAGHLHLAGNMHVSPLVYFRTTRSGDASSLVRIPTMVDAKVERRVTYPRFIAGPGGSLVFRYRNGSSGRGNDHYNIYDVEHARWRALVDGPLTDGQGRMNGYFTAPALGPDGWFHMVGVWRDTPDAATNHDPSYARSRDLLNWEKADGTSIVLPITLGRADVVEHIPARQGVINGNCKLGFDLQDRPVVTYHRYDSEGNSQLFASRFVKGAWQVIQISDWQGYRWDFGGGGSIPFEVRVGAVKKRDDGVLTLHFARKGESGTWALDPEMLKPTGMAPRSNVHRASLGKVESSFPGMRVRSRGDSGTAEDEDVRYVLRWETLGPNRDRPRKGTMPEPSMLRLLRLVTPTE